MMQRIEDPLDLSTPFAEVLSTAQGVSEDLEALLDPETGFAPRMRDVIRDQISELEERGGIHSGIVREELELLRLEKNTWGLLQAVLPARKTTRPSRPSPQALLHQNPYTPPSTLAQAILNSSPVLSEMLVVKEWLQETAPLPPAPEVGVGYWRATRHELKMRGVIGNSGAKDRATDVSMDPDTVNRVGGVGLVGDDASYEKALVQSLYGYIRAGKLEEAIEACRRAQQPWRAASLRGSMLFKWKALSTDQSEEDQEEDEGDEDSEIWSGNRQRRLWKTMCVRSALSTSLSEQDRLLYAAIAPSSQTISLLKNACRTWEDHLWAEVSVLCEEREETELARLGGGFWENGVEGVEKGVETSDSRGEEDWKKEVVASLEKLKSVAVSDGPASDHAFHFAQLHIILDRTDSLFDTFAAGLQGGLYATSSFEYKSLTRFFAHLILYLHLIDLPTPPLSTQIILEAYIALLENAGQRELIAMYAGALGENAVERYAMFLVSLPLDVSANERRRTLLRAAEFGLDVTRVAIVAAERSMDLGLRKLPSSEDEDALPSLLSPPHPPSEDETLLLRSIEWTTFLGDMEDESQSTLPLALEQTNVILRHLLSRGRVKLAQGFVDSLPGELANVGEPEENATEYLHYRQFFVVWEGLERVVECEGRGASFGLTTGNVQGKREWMVEYKELVERAYEQVVGLLTTEWLVSESDGDRLSSRQNVLRKIRHLYIPELILRLHAHLVMSRPYFPDNLRRALELANIVADERYKVYDDFLPVVGLSGGDVDMNGTRTGGRTLAVYLGAVRSAVLEGLKGGGSDPFRVVQVRS